jgi:hypothetical protein
VNECNGSAVVTFDDDYKDVEQDFEFSYVSGEEKSNIALQNEYIQELLQYTKLEIFRKDQVTRAYTSKKELGLFHLFLTKAFLKFCTLGQALALKKRGKRKFCIKHFGVHWFGNGNVN